jgi:hypothetical protein
MIETYTIYRHPDDYPDGYVIRAWGVIDAIVFPGPAARVATLAEARRLVPRGAMCLGRAAGDDEKIVESWIT